MRQKFKLIVLALAVALAFTMCEEETEVRLGKLEVTVKDQATSEPLRASVTLSPGSNSSKETDGQTGKCTFTGLDPEVNYTVLVTRAGYNDYEYKNIFVVAGNSPTPILVELEPLQGVISIAAPVSSSNWQVGEQEEIKWSSTDVEGNLKIELWKSTDLIKTIDPNTGNDGSYEWTIPTDLEAGNDYKIRISSVDDAEVNAESDYFTIYKYPSPVATTNSQSNVTHNSATLNGTVNANGRETTVTFLWGTSTNTLTNEVAASPNLVTGEEAVEVHCNLTGLSSANTYYYKVKAESDGGIDQGSVFSFTTTSLQAPTVTTLNATTISPDGATLNGSVNANGLSTTIVFEYGETTSYGQTITAAPSPVSGTTNTNVSAQLQNILSSSTTYNYRIVATNEGGTSYGENIAFTTSAAGLPSVTTQTPIDPSYNSAYFSGNITSLGNGAVQVTEHGHVWSATNPSPDLDNCDGFTELGTTDQTGVYTSYLSNLISDQSYYVKAYCENVSGLVYGNVVTFNTTMPEPSGIVTTYMPTNITQVTADISGKIKSFPVGASSAVAHGFCWSTSPAPTLSNQNHNLGYTSSTGVVFTHTITGLSSNQTYYVRSFVTTGAGTLYGNQIIFNTLNK